MLASILVLLTVFIGALFYLTNKRPRNYAPVPKLSFPVLGHFPYFGKYEVIGLHRMFMDWGRDCGSPIFGVDFGACRAVIMNDYKLIKEAWNMPELSGRLVARALSFRGGDEGINRGVIWSDGDHWAEQRRFAQRNLGEFGFGTKSMEGMIMLEAEELVAILKKQSGKAISTFTLFNPAVVNSFWQICVGERFSHDDPELAQMVLAVVQNAQDAKSMGTLMFMEWFCRLAPALSGWTSYANAFLVFDNFISKFVEKKMASHEPGLRRDFTDLYLNEILSTTDPGSSFYGTEGKKQLINTLGDIFAAGSETTSMTMSWLCLYLALHPEFQDKLHTEIDDILGMDRLPTLHARASMPYTEACIQETLRLSSIVPISLFHRAEKDVYLQGTFIPKNTTVISNTYGVHHDPDIWGPDVEEFSPQRFLSEDGSKVLRREELLAFSCGKRLCIGENLARNELFLFAASIFQRFSVRPDPNAPRPAMTQNCGGFVCAPTPHKIVFTLR